MECLEWNLVAASIASVLSPASWVRGPRMLQSRQRSGPSNTINIVIIVFVVIIVHGPTSFAGTSSLPSPSQTSLFETLSDDMPSHIRMALTRTSESIPIAAGQLRLGTWQGLFLFEHRAHGSERSVVVSVIGTTE